MYEWAIDEVLLAEVGDVWQLFYLLGGTLI